MYVCSPIECIWVMAFSMGAGTESYGYNTSMRMDFYYKRLRVHETACL